MKYCLLISLFFAAFFYCCSEDEELQENITYGQNYFTTIVDGDTREYYVHIPLSYDGNEKTPVVFMLHGASGNGDITYRNSGWRTLGETENFISVFPTAWSYCWIKNTGVLKDTTRWNSLPGLFEFCDGESPRDDVKFISQIISELQEKYAIDSKRIYIAGFSSGGQMGYRCAVEMSDLITAVVQSGGTHQIGTSLSPKRNIPIAFELGNRDASWFKNGLYPPLSLFDTLLTSSNLFKNIVNAHTETFDFETTYEISGDENSALTATFKGIPDPNRTFKFTLIEGLDHSYPNGFNHPVYGAKHHWEWMKQYAIE